MITFDGGYNRTGRITAAFCMCAACKTHQFCAVVNNSEDEYRDGNICLACATTLITTYANKPKIDVCLLNDEQAKDLMKEVDGQWYQEWLDDEGSIAELRADLQRMV